LSHGVTTVSKAFNDAVDQSLRGILGDVAAEAVYDHLQRNYDLPREAIFTDFLKFSAALRGIFTGVSPTIERAIAKRFYSILGLTFIAQPRLTLQDYVDGAIFARAARPAEKQMIAPDHELQVLVDFVKNLKPTQHVILFYYEPELKRQLLFAYLKAGLDNGEAAAYITSQETPEQIKEAMRKFSIDVDGYEAAGALRVIPYTEWYYLDGHFDVCRTKNLWQNLYEQTSARGFKGLRVTGEVSCFFDRGDVNELVAYEESLHKNVELPMAVICAYDTSQVPPRIFHNLIAAHGNSLFIGPEIRITA
jgi:hypothetical protein